MHCCPNYPIGFFPPLSSLWWLLQSILYGWINLSNSLQVNQTKIVKKIFWTLATRLSLEKKIPCVSKYSEYKMVWCSLVGKQPWRWISPRHWGFSASANHCFTNQGSSWWLIDSTYQKNPFSCLSHSAFLCKWLCEVFKNKICKLRFISNGILGQISLSVAADGLLCEIFFFSCYRNMPTYFCLSDLLENCLLCCPMLTGVNHFSSSDKAD